MRPDARFVFGAARDDPTRGVDVGTKGEIFQLMRDLAGKLSRTTAELTEARNELRRKAH